MGLDHSLPQDHGDILHEPHESHSYSKPAPKCFPGSDHVTNAEITQMVDARHEDLPWRMKVWLVSSKISQPSTIILSMARFFLMFSVSLTSSCIILSARTQTGSLSEIFVLPWPENKEPHLGTCIGVSGAVREADWTSGPQQAMTQSKATVHHDSTDQRVSDCEFPGNAAGKCNRKATCYFLKSF